jgi:hypothetical protein
VFFPDLWVVGDDVLVAVETFFHRGNAREMRPIHIGVAKLALDFLYPGVNPVTERDGLFRTQVSGRHQVKGVKEHSNQPQTRQG